MMDVTRTAAVLHPSHAEVMMTSHASAASLAKVTAQAFRAL